MTTSAPAIADRVRRASVWSGVNTVLMRLVNIVVMAVVARLISPEEFGVFALTMVAFGMIQSIGELGLTSAIARVDLDLDEIAPTVVTITWISSAAIAGLFFALAHPIALLLGSADATMPLQIMAVCVLLGGPISVPNNQLLREFRGDLVFRANLIAFPFATVSLLGFAAAGDGAVAFALSRVIGIFVTGVVLFALVPRRYGPGFSFSVARKIVPFGLPVSLSNLLAQVVLNVDFVIVSRLLSVEATGFYNLAFNVSTWSTAVLQATLSSVVLPAFSHVLGRGGDARSAMRRGVEATIVLAFPIAAVTGALAAPLVSVVYGERWAAAAPVLAVLSVYGATSVIGLLLSDVLIASGRTGIMAGVQAGALALLVPALWGAILWFGLIGAGLAHMAVVLLATLPFYLVAIRRAIGVTARDVLLPAALPFVASVLAGICGYLVTLLPLADIGRLLIGGVVMGIVYLLVAARPLRRLLPDVTGRRSRLHRVIDVVARPTDRIARGWGKTANVA